MGQPQLFGHASEEQSGKGWGVRYRMGTQAPALLLCMAELRCKSKKGPVQVHMLAWHKNKGAQLAAPCLPLLSIPEHIYCWPGRIRWILDLTPVPGLKPQAWHLSLGCLCHTALAQQSGTWVGLPVVGMAQFGAPQGKEPGWLLAFWELCCRQG